MFPQPAARKAIGRLRSVTLISFIVSALFVSLWWLLSATAVQAQADTYYVTENGTGSCAVNDPCALSDALALAAAGDEIRMAQGTYASVSAAPVVTLTQPITLSGGFAVGSWDTADPTLNPTYLDGSGNGRVIEIQGTIAPTIQGFYIRNGQTGGNTDDAGAAIYNPDGRPLIRHNVIFNNATDNQGGAIFDGGGATVVNNQIYNNTAGSGGGGLAIHDSGNTSVLRLNDVYSNTTPGLGGGIYIESNATVQLEANSIYDNQAATYGGVYIASGTTTAFYSNFIYSNEASNQGGGLILNGTATVWNNTIAGNTAGTNVGGVAFAGGAVVEFSNNIVALNTSGNIDGVADFGATVTGGDNNIFDSGDALGLPNTYTHTPGFLNTAADNYRLASGSANIDLGNTSAPGANTIDVDGQDRRNGTIDIGGDEFYTDFPAVDLTPATRTDYVDRGTNYAFNHLLQNTGTLADTYTFACSNDSWTIVSCPGSVSLQPGATASVQTIIQVPAGAVSFDSTTTAITATSQVSPSLFSRATATAIVNPIVDLAFTPSYSETVLPGETITYTHRLTNTGDAIDIFDVQLLPGSDWAELLPSNRFRVELAPGLGRDIQVRVTVPPQAAAGLANETQIQASSDFDPTVAAIVTDTVTARPTIGTRHVGTAGQDTNNNCTQADNPCGTLSHAIGQASFDDEIRLGAGVFEEAGIPLNSAVRISGGWVSGFRAQSEDPTATEIDGLQSTRILNIAPGTDVRPTISNLTLRNGSAAGPGGAVRVGASARPVFSQVIFAENNGSRGGALFAEPGSTVLIEQGVFISNTAGTDGGAIYGSSATLSLQQSTIISSMAANGGGLYVDNGLIRAQNNRFSGNSVTGDGAAVFISDAVEAILGNNTIADNTAGGNGGGLYTDLPAVTLVNNLFVSNTAAGDGGAVFHTGNGTVALSYSDVWDNSTTELVNVDEGVGNFSADPMFADSAYRLARRSPALDAGDPATVLVVDFEDDARPADQGFDVGYDELAGCRVQRDGIIYGNIQGAVDVVSDDPIVRISGICRGVDTREVDGQTLRQTVFLDEELTLEGGWNSDFSERNGQPTFIDPEGLGRALYISGPIEPVIEEITIQNGDATGLGGGEAAQSVDAGGNIYNLDSRPTFTALTIISGTAEIGGGLYNHIGIPKFDILPAGFRNSEPILTRINRNQASRGAGLYNFSGPMTIDGLRLFENAASTNGGGIYNSAPITIVNTILSANQAANGAAIYNDTTQATGLYHLTVVSNTATTSGGGIYSTAGAPIIRSNIFQGNAAGSGSAVFLAAGDADIDYNYYYANSGTAVVGDTTGANDISSSTPPGLLAPGADFRLADEAPAVDVADPDSPFITDAEDDPRPSNQGPDMGADEVVGCLANLNGRIYGSIQAAIEDAEPGDLILVSGECTGVHNVDVGSIPGSGACGTTFQATVHITKSVNLQGGWTPDFTEQTLPTYLDARQLGRVLYVGPGITSTVEGFNMLNGAVGGSGGGVCLDNDSAPLIRGNSIYSNTAAAGSAVYAADSLGVVDGNRIYNNSGQDGTVQVDGTAAATAIQNNFIYSNTVTADGGGIYNATGDHLLWHNTIYGNTAAGSGGGVYVAAGAPPIRSNIIMSNTAGSGDGVFGVTGSTADLGYNNFFNQVENFGGNITNGGPGSLSVNPAFQNAAQFNFSIPITSPVVDMGDPTMPITNDYELDLRPSHQGFDIGADEFGGCFARVESAPLVIYGSVAEAVDVAANGDRVEVSGTCYGTSAETLLGGDVVDQALFIDNKTLTIAGDSWEYLGNGPGVLDGLSEGRLVYLQTGAAITLTGITLQNGDAVVTGGDPYGGAIFNQGTLILDNVDISTSNAQRGGGLYNEGFVTVRNESKLELNTAVDGGAAYNAVVGSGEMVLTGGTEVISNTVSSNGAAVYQAAGRLLVDGTKIYGNQANADGSVYLSGGTAALVDVRNSFIYRNTAARGSGVYNDNTDARIWHNTIVGNNGDGIYSNSSAGDTAHSNIVDRNTGRGIYATTVATDLDYNNVVGNGTDYDGAATAGANAISEPPFYVNATADDYHLFELSPGVDVGDPSINSVDIRTDFDGDVRPTNRGPDIGADELNTCLIRVEEEIFGVLQEAIDYAEDNFAAPRPTIEIARGACRGVQTRSGRQQVGYFSSDLTIVGSLTRQAFTQPSPSDFNNLDILANSSLLDAQGEGRVIYIEPGVTVSFTHVIFANGDAGTENGGGIFNNGGEINTSETNVCANTAVNGGGYYGSDNSSAEFRGGGNGDCRHAVFNDEDALTGYTPLLGNTAGNNGGAFYVTAAGQMDIVNHGIDNNTAGNRGGAIYDESASTTTVINATIAENVAGENGGGIYNTGGLELYHNTIVSNQAPTGRGGGIFNESSGAFLINSSIVYSNTASSGGGGIDSSVGSGDYNLYDSNLPNDTFGFSTNANDLFVPPQFVAGTYNLSRYSPAIDEADPALLTMPVLGFDGIDFDSGNLTRPDVAPGYPGVAADIGADEYWKEAGCAVLPTDETADLLPGESVTYTVEIHNVGNPSYLDDPLSRGYTDTLTVTIDSQIADWVTFGGGEEQFVTLDWQRFTTRTLNVSVPITAGLGLQERSIVRCRSNAISTRTNTGTYVTNVGLSGALLITPQYVDSAQPGTVLTYTHTITNVGNGTDTFSIVPNAGAQGLSTAELLYPDSGGAVTTTVELDVNEAITAVLRVTILDSAESGLVATPGIVVRSTTAEDPPVEASVLNQITILPIPGTRYVALNGDDTGNNCRVAISPCATVQQAISAAAPGDAIHIAGGTYTGQETVTVGGDLLEQAILVDKSVTLRGGFTTADEFASAEPFTNTTTLDGLNERRVLLLRDGITVTISGLFIQNGASTAAANSDERPNIGGGIYNLGANLTITASSVISNDAQFGGGIYHTAGELTIGSTVIAANTNEPNPTGDVGAGGGLYIESGDVWLENNTFADNRADLIGSRPAGDLTLRAPAPITTSTGAAVYGNSGTLNMLNNLFDRNIAQLGASIYISGSNVITHNFSLFNDHLTDPTVNIADGPDSITGSPDFLPGFYLIGATSAAKDAGTNIGLRFADGVDIQGEPRVNNGVADIGADERFQRPSFAFLPTPRTQTVNTGQTAVYTHTLANTGDTNDSYTLAITNQLVPDDTPAWDFALTPAAGTPIPLNIGEQATVTLVITGGLPGYVNTSIITATADSGGRASVRDTTTVSSTAGVDIAPNRIGSGDPGQAVQYTHTLTNTGDGVDTFSIRPITTTATPAGWMVSVDPAESGFVPAGGSIPFTVTVDIPAGTAAGVTHTVGIEAVAVDPDARDILTDTTTVQASFGLDLSPGMTRTVTSGNAAVYMHTLTNTGNIEDTITLTVTGTPDDWPVQIEPVALTLAGGATGSVAVTVTAPITAAGGAVHTATVTAASTGDPSLMDTAVDTTLIGVEATIMIAPDNQQIVDAGTTVGYMHTVTNTGNTSGSYTLSAAGTQGWLDGFAPAALTLAPGESAGVMVTVTVPAAAAPGVEDTTTITVTADSDPAVFDTAVDTTRVRQQHGLELAPSNIFTTAAGTTVNYNHTITNTGNGNDTFAFTAVSSQGWAINTPPDVTLPAGDVQLVTVTLTVPAGVGAVTDIMQVSAGSIISSAASAGVTNTTIVTAATPVLAVNLTPDNAVTAAPGDIVTYTHTLANTGNISGTFQLAAVSSQGWDTTLTPMTVTLDGGETVPVQFVLDVPLTADMTDLSTVTATAVDDASITASATNTTTIDIAGALGVMLDPMAQTGIGQPGETVTFTHRLTNTGRLTDTYLLDVTTNNGWVASVSPSFTSPLAPDEGITVTVVVEIDAGAAGGDSTIATVTATSQTEPSVQATADDTVLALVQGEGVLLDPDNVAAGFPGDTIRYTHTLTNTGTSTETFSLVANSSRGWTVTVLPDTRLNNVAPNETVLITVTVAIPTTAVGGQEDVTSIIATALSDTAITDFALDTTQVQAFVYDAQLTPDNALTVQAGTAVTYTHTLTNTGNVTDTFALSVSSTEGWAPIVMPVSATLAAGESVPVVVTLSVPTTAVSGTVDTTTVTAVSQSDPAVTATATDTTTVIGEPPVDGPNLVYLPIIIAPPSPTGIDLVVTEIRVEPAVPQSGQPSTVYVTIRNQGVNSVPFGNNFYLDFYVDRMPRPLLVGDIQWGVQGALLEAGASVTFDETYTFSGGAHTLWAQVDTDDTVNEYPNDYNNNMLGPITITVDGAALFEQESEPVPNEFGPRPTPQP